MQDFRSYIWKGIGRGILGLWLGLVVISAATYTGVILLLKNKELSSGLHVAGYTVDQALQAGDWPLALGHLGQLESAGPVFNIQLRKQRANTVVTGPFGQPPIGLGSICKSVPAGAELAVSGCMRIFGATEGFTLLLFSLFSSLLFLVTFKFFRTKMLYFIDRVSGQIKGMRALETETPIEIEGGISEIAAVREYILGLLKEREEAAESLAFSKLSAQVAHDIRSPLTVFDSILSDLSQLPEEKRVMIRRAIGRIRDIANNVLDKNRLILKEPIHVPKGVLSGIQVELVSSHLESIVSEKRYQYADLSELEIDCLKSDAYGLFARIDQVEFKRVISNIINNSVEATDGKGRVEISLSGNSREITVTISDNGKGISADVLPMVGQPGKTFGKSNGSGLGIYHAKTTIASWGGVLTIESQRGEGTRVQISLPGVCSPAWFVPALEIPENSHVVVLDDDETIHITWESRLEAIEPKKNGIQIHHLHSSAEFIKWWKTRPSTSPILFLFDYELIGDTTNGLELIRDFKLSDRAILVTSRFEEPTLLQGCVDANIKVIPKSMAHFVPIRLGLSDPDAILIDDDQIIQMNWESAAKESGKRLKFFSSADAFFPMAKHISKTTPIFIDSNLGKNIRGELIAKDIFSMGFEDIHLTTGYDADEFAAMPWLKGVIGKQPPWSVGKGGGNQ